MTSNQKAMEFRIADTFLDSLSRLTGDEQKAVKTTAFDLQMNPANPGMQFHKLDRAKDPNFWSIRVSRDIRLIVHRTGTSLLLCYVNHHDEAYKWAERRKIEIHPITGAAQIVEIRERVEEVVVRKYLETEVAPASKPPLFEHLSDSDLLGYGVPIEWMPDVRKANEDTLLGLSDHLPSEAAEALIDLATGGVPSSIPLAPPTRPVMASATIRGVPLRAMIPPGAESSTVSKESFEHPDAKRRFRLIGNLEELKGALDYPWEKWMVFLHPSQRELVDRDYNGPARVSGSAGTGKTIVAIHRVVSLARKNPDSRLLLTTFSDPLSNALEIRLRHLVGNQPRLRERIEIKAMNSLGRGLYEANIGKPQFADRETIQELLKQASQAAKENRFSVRFLMTEWEQVVDAWQLEAWESYRDVLRLGRRTRLKEAQRAVAWGIFEHVRSALNTKGLITHSQMFSRLAGHYAGKNSVPFDFLVVDEAQDISISQLRFLAALGGDRENSLFFAGDLGQRIFQQPFSWKALGVDIRGRSTNLRINYRTSHQIRMQADRLLGPEVSDVDGNTEERNTTVSLFNGPPPTIRTLDSIGREAEATGDWLKGVVKEGIQPHEIAIFVRSAAELDRARAAADAAVLPYKVLDERVETTHGKASIATMHLAKGLEFRAVAVMACDDEVIPQQKRIETVADDSDLEEVYNTERHLLYVACTRARDHLLVTGVDPASEFLDDLREFSQ